MLSTRLTIIIVVMGKKQLIPEYPKISLTPN